MDKRIKVYCGWPSTGLSETYHIFLLRNLQDRYGDRVELVLPEQCAHRMMHDFARNAITEEFLASDCDVLWMLDSDVVPPNHILDLITCHWDKWQCAGAPYPIYAQVPGTDHMSIMFTVYKGVTEADKDGGRGIYMNETPSEGTEIVDGLATGCLFIKREVFSKLEKPYFEFKFDPESRRVKVGEDLGFALKCFDQGIKFFVDYSAVCKHLKRVCLLDMQNYATQMSNHKTLEYDKHVRSQVNAALQAAYEKGRNDALEEAITARQPPKTKSGLILPANFKT